MNLTQSLLNNIIDVLDYLNRQFKPTQNPVNVMLNGLVLTILASFTENELILTLIFIYSIVYLLISRTSIYMWFKILLTASIFSLIIILPYIACSIYRLEVPAYIAGKDYNFRQLFIFVARVSVSISVFTAFITSIGWYGVLNSLKYLRFPNSLITVFLHVMINLPLLFIEFSRVIAAREARILNKTGFYNIWRLLSSALGDVVVRGYYRAGIAGKAMSSRIFTDGYSIGGYYNNGLKATDYILIIATIQIIILYIIFTI